MIKRLQDKMKFKERDINIAADAIIVMDIYFSITTVYPVEGIMSTGRMSSSDIYDVNNNVHSAEFDEALHCRMKEMFTMIFAFMEHKEKIMDYFEESGWETLNELEEEEYNELKEKAEKSINGTEGGMDIFATLYLYESGSDNSISELILKEVMHKAETLCGCRFEKDNFLKLMKTDLSLQQ